MRGRKRTLSLIIAILFVGGLAYVTIQVRNHGFSARDEPAWYEKVLARHARRIATPSDAKRLTNPVTATDGTMAEAREHFEEHCALCHGRDGRGDATIARNLYPKAPDMTDAATQQLSDGELFYIISNGVRFTGMPAWESEDSPESIWALVAYLRRLPELSPQDLQEPAKSGEGADQGSHSKERMQLEEPDHSREHTHRHHEH